MRTVPIGINLLMGQHAYDWSQMMAYRRSWFNTCYNIICIFSKILFFLLQECHQEALRVDFIKGG